MTNTLVAWEVTHVALESTGEYWKPVYNLLEGNVTVLVVNAQHVKHVPGHKTDVQDAEWLAELLVHGLLKASFIPPKPQRDLRDSDPLSRHAGRRARTGGQPGAEGIGERQHQTGQRCNRCLGRVGTPDAGSTGCWSDGCRDDG